MGKSNGKKWSHIWTFLFGSGLKSLQILPYKTCWKPRFPMDERPLVEGYIANFGISLDVFEFLRFGWFFPFFKKFGFLGILGPPYCGIGATIRIGREMLCLPYAGFSKHRPSGPMLSISRYVHMFVCVSVCVSVCSLLRYRLTVFLPPLPEVRCPIFFRDSESLGKSNGKKWSHIWTFLFGKGLKSPRKRVYR